MLPAARNVEQYFVLDRQPRKYNFLVLSYHLALRVTNYEMIDRTILENSLDGV